VKDWIRENWRRLEPWQQIMAGVGFMIIAYLCLFLASYGCGWSVVVVFLLKLLRPLE
jgi:hypothetical protein